MAVPADEFALTLRQCQWVPWADFLLNPRRLRGSDFLMRWSQGRWSEERLIAAVQQTGMFFAIPYGPSGTAPDDPRGFELYFERLEHAGLGRVKRPDLMVFPHVARDQVDRILVGLDRRVSLEGLDRKLDGLGKLPFVPESDPEVKELLGLAVLAVECENSLWKSRMMPDYGTELKPQKRLGGKLGVKKSAVLPTVIIKEEDRAPLRGWQRQHGVPIHVWHVFFDQAFGLPLDRAEELIRENLVDGSEQVYQAPGGATTRKVIYKFPYHYAYELADASEPPTLVGSHVEDKNGHILPYVRFDGGKVALKPAAIEQLQAAAQGRGR